MVWRARGAHREGEVVYGLGRSAVGDYVPAAGGLVGRLGIKPFDKWGVVWSAQGGEGGRTGPKRVAQRTAVVLSVDRIGRVRAQAGKGHRVVYRAKRSSGTLDKSAGPPFEIVVGSAAAYVKSRAGRSDVDDCGERRVRARRRSIGDDDFVVFYGSPRKVGARAQGEGTAFVVHDAQTSLAQHSIGRNSETQIGRERLRCV